MNPQAKATTDLRLAEFMAAISLATDLGNGYALEQALRKSLLAVGVARELGLNGQELSDVFYTALLEHLGCTATSHELAAGFGGEDNAIRRVQLTGDPALIRKAFSEGAKRMSPIEVGMIFVRVVASGGGRRMRQLHAVATCEAADRLAGRLGMSTGVRRALSHVYTRWDGKGFPPISGEAIQLPARITRLAFLVEVYEQLGGRDAAETMVRRRAGVDVDPTVATTFLRHADALLGQLEAESVWDAALQAEPEPRPWLPPSRLDEVAYAFADFTDLKSPFMLGHSAGVAEIAEKAAAAMGFDDVTQVRRAALLHDLGRVSVPNGIWDKRGPLTGSEWERVRLHPYYSERILSHSPLLAPLGQAAGMHHERLDGSGYHHGASAPAISRTARLLAAADAYQAMGEERPHRAAHSPPAAGEQLRHMAAAGWLDRDAVNAVLEGAGERRPRERAAWPAGLSDREVDVLRLVARGKPDKEIGRALFISRNTVHHHMKQIYEKIEVSSRAGAALFAMEHDLIPR